MVTEIGLLEGFLSHRSVPTDNFQSAPRQQMLVLPKARKPVVRGDMMGSSRGYATSHCLRLTTSCLPGCHHTVGLFWSDITGNVLLGIAQEIISCLPLPQKLQGNRASLGHAVTPTSSKAPQGLELPVLGSPWPS